LLIAGVVWWSLVPLVVGYVLTPIAIRLDSRYLESVSPGWQHDGGCTSSALRSHRSF
jgi:hypothetical protein